MTWIVSAKETRKLIDMRQALRAVEGIFRDRAAGKVRSLPRRRLSGSKRVLNLMASQHVGWDLLCVRAYTSFANTITLYDGRSGEMRVIFNAGYLSSLRTGAASGVAAKHLAPAGAKVLGLIGVGRQATFQIEAIAPVCRLREILVFARSPQKRKRFVDQMKKVIRVPFRVVSTIEEVEEQSDIVVVATSATSSVVQGRRLKDRVLVITMGANAPAKHEVSLGLIRRMDLVVTDDLPTAQTGSGDLMKACASGVVRWEKVVPLERIVAVAGRRTSARRILFQSNGIADEDLAVGYHVLRQIRKQKTKVKSVAEI